MTFLSTVVRDGLMDISPAYSCLIFIASTTDLCRNEEMSLKIRVIIICKRTPVHGPAKKLPCNVHAQYSDLRSPIKRWILYVLLFYLQYPPEQNRCTCNWCCKHGWSFFTCLFQRAGESFLRFIHQSQHWKLLTSWHKHYNQSDAFSHVPVKREHD